MLHVGWYKLNSSNSVGYLVWLKLIQMFLKQILFILLYIFYKTHNSVIYIFFINIFFTFIQYLVDEDTVL